MTILIIILIVAALAGALKHYMDQAAAPMAKPYSEDDDLRLVEVLEVVGESHYQDALASIAGPKTRQGVSHACIATLVLENSNPHDANAVRVDVDGKTVGHLSRDTAPMFRNAVVNAKLGDGPHTVDAEICGGWINGSDEGHYGLRLVAADDMDDDED